MREYGSSAATCSHPQRIRGYGCDRSCKNKLVLLWHYQGQAIVIFFFGSCSFYNATHTKKPVARTAIFRHVHQRLYHHLQRPDIDPSHPPPAKPIRFRDTRVNFLITDSTLHPGTVGPCTTAWRAVHAICSTNLSRAGRLQPRGAKILKNTRS